MSCLNQASIPSLRTKQNTYKMILTSCAAYLYELLPSHLPPIELHINCIQTLRSRTGRRGSRSQGQVRLTSGATNGNSVSLPCV